MLHCENDSVKIIDFSKIHQTPSDNALRENDGFENKNNANNGGSPETCSEISAERLTNELSARVWDL